MWTVDLASQADSLLQGVMLRNGAPASYRDASSAWLTDDEARASLLEALSRVPFAGFRWECPPLTSSTAGRPFEFVVVGDSSLARAADFGPFATHLASASGDVVSFPTLGRDAQLVVPVPTRPMRDYSHLAAFLRNSPEQSQHSLLTEVARQVLARISERPLWLSTAGGGVAWLHVRLDSTPKYYAHQPYRCRPV